MAKGFVTRGVPLHGVGFEMHIDTTGYPTSSGLAQSIQALNALGLQVHITEMDVRLPVDSNENATAANLQAQAATYQRILTVCLQNPVPGSFPGYGAALPFNVNYQPKPAVASVLPWPWCHPI